MYGPHGWTVGQGVQTAVADRGFESGQLRSQIAAAGQTAAVTDRGYRPDSRGRGPRLQAWQPRSETATVGLTAAVGDRGYRLDSSGRGPGYSVFGLDGWEFPLF